MTTVFWPWFVAMNAVVVAIAVLSSCARPCHGAEQRVQLDHNNPPREAAESIQTRLRMTTVFWPWFVAMNAVVVAIAVLSSCARPCHGAAGVTRRASSSGVLQSLRSLSIFSFPSACLSYLHPDDDDAAATADQETEEPVARSPVVKPSPRALPLAPPPAADEEGEEDPNAMSMEEAYAIVLASQQRPERERQEEARKSEVDAKAEEFIRRFNEDLRQQRLNSISNYTQMLKSRAAASGRRRPDVQVADYR